MFLHTKKAFPIQGLIHSAQTSGHGQAIKAPPYKAYKQNALENPPLLTAKSSTLGNGGQ